MKLKSKTIINVLCMLALALTLSLNLSVKANAEEDCAHAQLEVEVVRSHDDQKHEVFYKCSSCGEAYNTVHPDERFHGYVAHTYTLKPDSYDDTSRGHWEKCSVCGWEKSVACNPVLTSTKKKDADVHTLVYRCACGNETEKDKKHAMNGNTCKTCGYTRIIPGNTKIVSMKQSKKWVKHVEKHPGRWANSTTGYKWIPAYTSTYYTASVKINVKKAKNVYRYVVSTNKNIKENLNISNYSFGKNKFTLKLSMPKKSKKLTIYVAAVSKTGDISKVVKKKITMR